MVHNYVIKCEDWGALRVFKEVCLSGTLMQIHVFSISGKAPVLERTLGLKASGHRQGSCLCLGSSENQITILGFCFSSPKGKEIIPAFFCEDQRLSKFPGSEKSFQSTDY